MSQPEIGSVAASAARSLQALARSGDPVAAVAESKRLSGALDGALVRALWEEQPGAGRWHFDFLVEFRDGGVLSLGYVEAGGRPFPLRSANRATERDLVRVNGRTLSVALGMTVLDVIWRREAILDQIISRMIIQEWIERLDIEVTEAERQAGLDDWRMRRALLSASDTHRWLASHGITLDMLERLIDDEVAAGKLLRRITEDRVAEALEADASLARRTQWSWMAVHLRDAHLFAQSADCADDVFRAAATAASADALVASGFFQGSLALPAGLAHLPGTDLARTGGGTRIDGNGLSYLVFIDVSSPGEGDDVRQRVMDRLFDEWLRDQRSRAEVEWFWGPG